MNSVRTLMTALMLLLGVSLHGQPKKMELVEKVPLSQLATKPLAWAKEDGGYWLRHTPNDFGFLTGGKTVLFGHGGWIYNLEARKLEKRFPDSLYWPLPSADGSLVVVSLEEEPYTPNFGPWGGRLAWFDTHGEIQPKPKWLPAAFPEHAALHPNSRILAVFDPEKRNLHYFTGIVFIDLQTGQRWKADGAKLGWGCDLTNMYGFTGNGRYLLLHSGTSGVIRLLDTRTFRLLPPNEEDGLVMSPDARLRAGGYDGGYANVWDRESNAYLWEGKPYSVPSAFSPNGKYLLCESTIVTADSGVLVFEGMQGKWGKFSPDGRSVVKYDDDAFYIYTLPKDSEPIFGLFQKPEPWSPPKAKPSKVKTKSKQ